MTDLRCTLVTDGASDRVLLHPLVWLLRRHLDPAISIQRQWADLRPVRQRPQGLSEKIQVALDLYPCDLLFVHRDAEKEDPQRRHDEIERAMSTLSLRAPPFVAVVPVRMTEAWLLFDEEAVRRAAGNPNGDQRIPIPAPDPEGIADPKVFLHEALRAASGLTGRRRDKVSPSSMVHRVADQIDDYAPLRGLSAFARLEHDLVEIVRRRGWM